MPRAPHSTRSERVGYRANRNGDASARWHGPPSRAVGLMRHHTPTGIGHEVLSSNRTGRSRLRHRRSTGILRSQWECEGLTDASRATDASTGGSSPYRSFEIRRVYGVTRVPDCYLIRTHEPGLLRHTSGATPASQQ